MPLVLLGSLACTGVGQTLLYAVLPLASREVGLGEARSAGVFALSALCWTLASPVWGRVCDRAGALPVLITGMLGQAASNLAVALVLAAALRGAAGPGALFAGLLALRAVNGALGSGVLPAAQSLAIRLAPSAPRVAVIGRIGSAFALGSLAGPGFAALLLPFGLAAPLAAAAALALAGACATALTLRGREPASARAESRRPGRLLPRGRLRRFALLQLGVGTAASVVAQATGFLLQDRLGVSGAAAARVVGACLTLQAAAGLAAQFTAMRRAAPPGALVRLGTAGTALAALALIPARGAWVLFPCLTGLSASLACVYLGLAVGASRAASAGGQGAAAGAMAAAGSLGALASALMVMPLYRVSPSLPLAAVAALALAVLAASRRILGGDKRPMGARWR